MGKKSVLVVGAGVAGLSAAHALRGRGFEVRVLEAGARIGGRAGSDFVEDCVLDRGAQLLSDGYVNVCRLIDELHLRDDLRPASPWTAVVLKGRGRAVSSARPWSVNTSGLLGMSDSLTLANGSRQLFKDTESLPLDNLSCWSQFDDEAADLWLARQFNDQILDYVFEPILQGFFFQEPEEMSRALAMLVWNFGGRGKLPRALLGGMEALVEALAEPLRVDLRSPVEALDITHDGVVARTAQACFSADHLVLAVPAPAARDIYTPVDEVETRLVSTAYSSAIVLALLIPDGLPKSSMPGDVHAIMIPRRERRVIGSVILVTRKCPIHVDRGELLNVMLSGAASRRLLDAPLDDILAEAIPELEFFYPGIKARVDTVRAFRWRDACAGTPVGRCRDLRIYRAHTGPRRVWLAGDYMGSPNLEGAVESGLWAARAIADREG
ncbi:protoporphyrinogen/coproporphyrinogen oxidase [Geoalkalibacter halelectricus]|uniref:FAD-dependent oxidoreductase n=1 Tax=Geoalkalibacter halelectricus TaxID=2847045 RepID=A0ABY5ZMJ6_9BACT|nr:NAD(P)/FAD-dependent oxidoreductase [Geoalkalibacter halelectricus]MDO3380094.1 FAD-dependent oxidoreductase [Geoalkalibacter halelectricus]UWZ80387.1 FAD-dependent oxidoreductase [Geoalkalibacter halelectricus]